MTDSDRKKIKDQQKGQYRTAAGIVDPIGAVKKLHRESFLIAIGADATFAEIGLSMHQDGEVVECEFTPSTALAAHASNYISMLVQKRDGAGGAAVTVASADTNTAGANVSLAAFTPQALTLTTTTANKRFVDGNVLTFKSTETGTPTTPIGNLRITVEYGVV
jgi:hypothetical protein